MPRVTKIITQKRRPNRRNVHIDGRFAFGVNVNVVARFRLREGMELSKEQIAQIVQGELRQEVFDTSISLLGRRLHGRAELRQKLMRREYGEAIIDEVLNDLERLGYVDDARFAKTRALSAAQHRQHGKRRAMVELLKKGVEAPVAGRAVDDVYDTTDSLAIARQLAQKQAPRLRRLDPIVARRRLAGMLLRRGFEYETVRPVIDEVLGYGDEESES